MWDIMCKFNSTEEVSTTVKNMQMKENNRTYDTEDATANTKSHTSMNGTKCKQSVDTLQNSINCAVCAA